MSAVYDFGPKLMNEREKRGFVDIMQRLTLNQIRKDEHRLERYGMRKNDRNDLHWILCLFTFKSRNISIITEYMHLALEDTQI